jgi:acetyltransferase-like isoleucine patch superfamily enzyme
MRYFFILMASMFFDKRYLSGRWFLEKKSGFKWVLHSIWCRNVLRLGRVYPFPVHLSCYISNPRNVIFHPDDLNNFQSRGTYFQCLEGKIYIGRGSYIAPNVGLITQNHVSGSPERHNEAFDIHIGDSCWIGMNSIILPGVMLGSRTTVAAGSVVTKSFTEGRVVVAGNPARVVRHLEC